MHRTNSRRVSGFTLVEMTIVLGIAGILFGGLWKMLSVGNAQMRDQATANQQLQLVAAVSNYLKSTDGQNYLNTATLPGTLALPASCSGVTTGFCAHLPTGFNSGTKNPYGQSYTIGVRKDGSTYSFMVMTSGGKVIPDASGGRISAAMGGDGGFVYNSNVCTTGTAPDLNTSHACGAYGAWKTVLTDYGFTIPAATGVVASRSYPSASLGSGDVWLARNLIPTDNTNRIYNTMTTPLFLGDAPMYFGKYNAASPAVQKTMYVQDGVIDLGSNGYLSGTGGDVVFSRDMAPMLTNPLVILNGACTKVSGTALVQSATCKVIMQANGDVNIIGLLQANTLYATGFIYGNVVAPSDRRLKTDIAPLADSLSNILKLQPVSYILKSSGQKSLGLIAQDAEKVYPELVTTAPSGYKAIAYEGMIAPLIDAVQQLKKENDELTTRMEEMSKRQTQLEKQLEKKSKE